ncbi:methyltransferase domain-containing protein [Streptomyces roseifaciens]|uniref:methyltransferase domain-containing protein n=1 Tax=Streptomyces roseifaciens TaxID=1488406 RepID=UPI0011873B5A|nr:class I SAM-dependent methyltransferase [Streptomyces roseifaciens]
MTTRRDAMDVIEGFYCSQTVWALHRLGVLPRLEDGADVPALAEEFALDEQLLSAVLDFIHRTTDLLVREDHHYRLAPSCRPYRRTAFHLEKFLGAYGPVIAGTATVLAAPGSGPELRDLPSLARAFGQLEPRSPSLTARVLRAWGVTSLFDLGCGAATLLVELATADPEFRGWGADSSDAMVKAADERISRSGLGGRLRILRSDVRELGGLTPRPDVEDVQALYGRSIANEFFADGGRSAVEVLTGLKELFPGRLLFLEDYYGRLTHHPPAGGNHRHTLLQDLAQVLSGQGVPPPDLPGWSGVYQAAGCSLVKAYEGHNEEISWFIHVLVLGRRPRPGPPSPRAMSRDRRHQAATVQPGGDGHDLPRCHGAAPGS